VDVSSHLERQLDSLRSAYHFERFPSLSIRLDRLRRVKAMLPENETA
jgi:hypothetical protein